MSKSIVFLRQKIGLSQSELAEYLSISRSTLGMAELGRVALNPAAVHRYGVALEVLTKTAPAAEPPLSTSPLPAAWVEKERAGLQKELDRIGKELEELQVQDRKIRWHKAWFESLRKRPEQAEWDLDTWCKAQEIRIRKPTRAETADRIRFLLLKREILQRQMAFWEENSA